MKIIWLFIIVIFLANFVQAQNTETIKFYSTVFQRERTIHITTPEFYQYQSKKVKLPVIFILDAQHEWFANPSINTIRYLQYTHQIPQALIVSIPLEDRIKECQIQSLQGEDLLLYQFIVHELDEKIQKYNPSQYKIIMGHSFSASFSLYAYLKNPTYFSAVIAHTPLDHFKDLIMAFEENENIAKENIFISAGGQAMHEDYYHRNSLEALKRDFPSFFDAIHTNIANNTNHNAVPILSTAPFLTKLFSSFNGRFSQIAKVNEAYTLIEIPKSIEEEIRKIESASTLANHFYPPEIAEFNGLASRYWSSNLNNFVIEIYKMGIKYYPYYFDFYLQLYYLHIPIDQQKSKEYLKKAENLINIFETNSIEKEAIIEEIMNEKVKNGW
ncbi:MAG: esterase family protein [Chitinophagales bacterium]|nr:esterase family protein [Chitinophagales bacterium]